MNDLAYQIKLEVDFHEGLANVNILSLTRNLNSIPFKAIGYEYPKTLFKSRVEQYLH